LTSTGVNRNKTFNRLGNSTRIDKIALERTPQHGHIHTANKPSTSAAAATDVPHIPPSNTIWLRTEEKSNSNQTANNEHGKAFPYLENQKLK
jgi:hypothetical protein